MTTTVPVSEIKHPTDMFRCEPYHCMMSAKTCVSRQGMLTKSTRERRGDYADCEGCQTGTHVRLRLKSAEAPATR